VLRPVEGHNATVTWDGRRPMPFVTKLMSVFVSMDRLIGKDFEAKRAKMKAPSAQPGS
jgi:hypothetical protein